MAKPAPKLWLFAGGEGLGGTKYGWMNTTTGMEAIPTEGFRMNHLKEHAQYMACQNTSVAVESGTHNVGTKGGPDDVIKKGDATQVNQEKRC